MLVDGVFAAANLCVIKIILKRVRITPANEFVYFGHYQRRFDTKVNKSFEANVGLACFT